MLCFHRIFALLALVSSLLLAGNAQGQLAVNLRLTNTTFLRFEDIPAFVVVKNNTGLAIPAGGNAGYSLTFDIKGSDGQPVGAIEQKDPPPLPALVPGAETIISNNLFRSYRFSETEQAVVVARVDYAGQSFLSPKVFLDFQKGIDVTRMQVPVGNRTLTYLLRRLMRDKHEHLFLRVDDESAGQTYGATDLGLFLRQPAPTIMPDAAGQIHVLHRSGPQQFTYHVARGDGAILRKELFSGDYQTVRMIATAQGEIQVSGKPTDEKDSLPILKQTPFAPEMHR